MNSELFCSQLLSVFNQSYQSNCYCNAQIHTGTFLEVIIIIHFERDFLTNITLPPADCDHLYDNLEATVTSRPSVRQVPVTKLKTTRSLRSKKGKCLVKLHCGSTCMHLTPICVIIYRKKVVHQTKPRVEEMKWLYWQYMYSGFEIICKLYQFHFLYWFSWQMCWFLGCRDLWLFSSGFSNWLKRYLSGNRWCWRMIFLS